MSPCPNTKSQRAYYARTQRTMLPKAACQIPDARRHVRNRSYGGLGWCSVKSCDIQWPGRHGIPYVAALRWILEQLLVQHYNQIESAASPKSAQHHNQADSCRSRRCAYAARFRPRLVASSILRVVLSAGKPFALEGSRSRRMRLSGLAGASNAKDGGRPTASLVMTLGSFRMLSCNDYG